MKAIFRQEWLFFERRRDWAIGAFKTIGILFLGNLLATIKLFQLRP